MSGERNGMRDAIDRVANRIKTESEQRGRAVSFEQAKREAVQKGIDFERRQERKK